MTLKTDIETAKNLRDTMGYTLAVVKDSETIFKSEGRGIFPLYSAYESGIDFSNASAADKVIGKGAAMFMVELGIAYLDTILISKPALEYLQANNIVVTYTNLVDYIANRSRDGKCPVETMAEKTSQFDALLNDVRQFLKRLEII